MYNTLVSRFKMQENGLTDQKQLLKEIRKSDER
jgi:hypothetical protein